jgi:hypothetical protein
VLQCLDPLASASKQITCDVRWYGEDHNLLSTQSGIGEKKRRKACRHKQRNLTAGSQFVRNLQSNTRKTATEKLLYDGKRRHRKPHGEERKKGNEIINFIIKRVNCVLRSHKMMDGAGKVRMKLMPNVYTVLATSLKITINGLDSSSV